MKISPNILEKFKVLPTHAVGTDSVFLSFEGIEGAGKSTLIKEFSQYLEKLGRKTTILREPGGTAFGEKLRDAILGAKNNLAPLAEAHLFASSRAQLMQELVLPTLAQKGQVVILDRYIDSSLAYQGGGRGLGMQTILELHQHEPLCFLPHHTFLLQIDLETSLKRQAERGGKKDYFEAEKKQFTQQLITSYTATTKLFPDRITVVDGMLSKQKLLETTIKLWQSWYL